ncbi:MAG: FAD-binding oxidoreductase [Desulfobacterales bacterium]|nr:FAD-binding oxidoreductase [Desulfobacterales bacterium]
MKKTADVVVIGGGIIGTAVTYYLAKKGLDVCSIERRGVADGTSGRCDGRVIVYDQVPGESCKLSKMSLDMYPDLSDELGFDISWTQEGTLLLMESEEEYQIAEKHCKAMVEEAGLPYVMLDYNQVHEQEPHLSKNVVGGLDVTCDGNVNPMAVVQGFSYAAKALGATVAAYTKVLDIKLDDKGSVAKVITDRGTIATKRVVNAAGIWAPELGRMIGLDIPIKPRQGQILVAERTFPIVKRPVSEFGYMMTKLEKSDYKRKLTPEMEKYGVAFALEPTEAMTSLIGTSRSFVGMDTSNSIEVMRAIGERAIQFYPVLQDVNIIRSYAGLRPYTPDHYPIISDTQIPGFYIAAGHEGNGIGMAPITGVLMADIITGEQPEMSVEPFAWSRFS